MTVPYPDAVSGSMSKAETRFLELRKITPPPYYDALSGDLLLTVLGSIEGGAFDNRGTFNLKLGIGFDMIGDPTEIMRSSGDLLVVEFRKFS